MARQVAIVHGWSDTSKSFGPLVAFLRGHGFDAVPIWLGDYLSLEDDVRIEDVAKRMDEVVREKMRSGQLGKHFDLIVHSTGGLVARRWLSTYYAPGRCPVRRLVMLAPANFGSKLAAMGQSMLGRVVKGWKNWFHTGKEMLSGLELASRFQWDLAQDDLFAPEGEPGASSPYGGDGVLPFVIVGTHPYTDNLRQIVNENGGDGTVRVCAANLNVHGLTLDFSRDEANPTMTPWTTRHGALRFPLAVLPDRTHGSVIDPDGTDVVSRAQEERRLGELILGALACRNAAEHAQIAQAWDAISEATAALSADAGARDLVVPPRKKWFGLAEERTPEEYFHQYLQVVVLVVDDHGREVPDWFLEFFGPHALSDDEAIYFHSQVLEDVHKNGARRCLYMDRTDLMAEYYRRIPGHLPKELRMSVSVSPPGDNVQFFSGKNHGAAGVVTVHDEAGTQRWLRRNCTHFLKIIVPRVPKKQVFRLAEAP